MSVKRGKPEKAWIVIADSVRPPASGSLFGGVKPNQPIAIFPPRTSIDKLVTAIDTLIQFQLDSPAERLAFRRKENAPYRAQPTNLSYEVSGGHNPILEAVKVDDLSHCVDDNTGESWFSYTRNGYFVDREDAVESIEA